MSQASVLNVEHSSQAFTEQQIKNIKESNNPKIEYVLQSFMNDKLKEHIANQFGVIGGSLPRNERSHPSAGPIPSNNRTQKDPKDEVICEIEDPDENEFGLGGLFD